MGFTFTFINVDQSAGETVMKVKVVYKKIIPQSLYLPGTFESFFGFPGTNTLFLTGLQGGSQPAGGAAYSVRGRVTCPVICLLSYVHYLLSTVLSTVLEVPSGLL